jgi:ABC-type transport system involved in cytochrome bd biosynthesis fused ATPase/permease subunit
MVRILVIVFQLRTVATTPFGVGNAASSFEFWMRQARLQILLLELTGATLLLLDEPTDNLDLASAEALQHGLREFTGTVLAITHDRWFAADFDRYLHFGRDGQVRETDEPRWW